jgi:GNAT superfamily N-acetyltransferase
MTEVSEAIRRLALHPFSEVQLGTGFTFVERPEFVLLLHPEAFAMVVEPRALAPDSVSTAVAEVRQAVREHGASHVVWLLGPDDVALGESLTAAGLRNAEAPGFEPVERVFVLTQPPGGTWPSDVTVAPVSSLEEFREASRVQGEAFGLPLEARQRAEAEIEQRWADASSSPGFISMNAMADSEVVGTAMAGLSDSGINLFGAAVLEPARGRGVYRALLHARWRMAVERGTPALTIQAGLMSAPIVEHLGFEEIAQLLVFADEL